MKNQPYPRSSNQSQSTREPSPSTLAQPSHFKPTKNSKLAIFCQIGQKPMNSILNKILKFSTQSTKNIPLATSESPKTQTRGQNPPQGLQTKKSHRPKKRQNQCFPTNFMEASILWVASYIGYTALNKSRIKILKKVDHLGIDPSASCMLNTRSTIWARDPITISGIIRSISLEFMTLWVVVSERSFTGKKGFWGFGNNSLKMNSL